MTTDNTLERLEALEKAGFITQAEALQLHELRVDAQRPPWSADVNADQRVALIQSAISGAESVVLDSVDMEGFHKGGAQWLRPAKACLIDGTTERFMIPEFTGTAQLWLVFSTPDGYRDFIAIAYTGPGAFKLRDVLSTLELPYEEDADHNRVRFSWPVNLPCKLRFETNQGRYKDEIRLTNVYLPKNAPKEVL